MNKGIRSIALVCAAFIGQSSLANDFETMTLGDHKTFASSNGNTITTEVIDTYGDNWKKYSSFLGKKDQWIWSSNQNNKLYWYNDNGEAELLVNFNDPVGKEYSVAIDHCTTKAVLSEKNAVVSLASGKFNNATVITFSGNCADAGLSHAIFAPQVGVVAYSKTTIAGPLTTELTTAEINGVTYPLFDGIKVEAQFPTGRIITNYQSSISAYLTLSNHSDSKETFTFPSSQLFEIEITNAYGEVVNKWSTNKRFMMAIQTVELAAGESKRFGGQIELKDFDGNTLDVGSYRVRIELKGTNKPEGNTFEAMPFAAESPIYVDQMMSINN